MDIHIICFVSDGASVNRKFYMDHYNEDCVKDGVLYKTRNLFEPERYNYAHIYNCCGQSVVENLCIKDTNYVCNGHAK